MSPHAPRHSLVNHLVKEAGMSIEQVQQLAGHALLITTQHYRTRDDGAAARAAEALEWLGGTE